jgi:hypothetical protein
MGIFSVIFLFFIFIYLDFLFRKFALYYSSLIFPLILYLLFHLSSFGRNPVAVVDPMRSSSASGSAKVNSAYSALRQNERCSRSAWRKARLTV